MADQNGITGPSEERLTEDQLDSIVMDLTTDIGSLSEEEFDGLYNQLDVDRQMEVDSAIRRFADNAVGDENWDL